ncbi:MAG: hypothetical protein HOP16_05070 [Acidobacteria bacterium]|nr:hypothetical protein [Acidobacteriota bacterium]
MFRILRQVVTSMLLLGVSYKDAQAQGTIEGQWTGASFTCPNERPRGMTLTLQERGGMLSGTLSADLSPDTSQSVTYKVRGTFAGTRFTLQPEPGQRMIPGTQITNIDGTFDARSEILTGTDQPSGCIVYGVVKRRLDTVDAPPPAPSAPQVVPPNAALAARVVRKPAAYWSGFKTATVKDVFDGDFGGDVGDSRQFRYLFAGYVETFSESCRPFLPADHTVLTVQVTNDLGTLDAESWHVDRALADKYRFYWQLLPNRAAGQVLMPNSPLITDLAAMDDAIRFLKVEGCQAPAVVQLRENLIRGSNGRLSLQQEARGGPVVPTFLNACLAVHDVSVSSRYHAVNAKAYCGCLDDESRNLMSPAEKRYYSEAFELRFTRNIAQPRELATDPNWAKFHPVVPRCAQ